jgi:GntR family transcriptional regulator of vanillate catabolism
MLQVNKNGAEDSLPNIDSVESRGASQTVKALLSMRELLLTGELSAGQRVSEIWAVDRLGVSRTPVRAALLRLEEEGFL